MGLYERYVCPHLTDWALDNRWVHEHRSELLSPLRGRVLELGFGTGANLRHYPSAVSELHVIDPSAGMHAKARRRLEGSPIPVVAHECGAEALPFEDARFDAVVCTFTLCSVNDPAAAAAEALRVLVPGGRLVLYEHVASESPAVRRWQDRLNPVQNVLGCGCHLNRDAEAIVSAAGFRPFLSRIGEPRTPRLFREHAFGYATKPEPLSGG